MLRIILNITLSLVLLITTTGYTIFEHYCGDKLVSVSINSEPETCCDMEGCCHNESEHFQIKEDFITTSINFSFENDNVINLKILSNIIYNINIPENLFNKNIYITESPPSLTLHSKLSKLQAYLL